MTYLGAKRLTASHTSLMTHVRRPVFVDNAVHIGELSVQGAEQPKVTVRQRKKVNYPIASERTYSITEEQDAVVLQNSTVPGHAAKAAQYEGRPPMLYASDAPSQRIRLGAVLDDSTTLKAAVQNMRGLSLLDLGFQSSQAHIGFPCDVGLRTTDLAMRLGTSLNTLTSVNLTKPRTAIAGNARRRHSTTFAAIDFKGVNLLTALRFIGRHDNRVAIFDRYGNLVYAPFTFSEGGRVIDANMRSGGSNTDPNEEGATAIVVKGVALALNEQAYAEVRDSERESGRAGNIIEEPQRVEDFTVRSNEGARRVARSVLKANNLSAGKKTSSGHPDLYDARPGTIIEYENVRRVLTEVRHRLSSNETDLVFLNVDIGIEGVLQGISEGIGDVSREPEQEEQIREHVFSMFGGLTVRSVAVVTLRGHGNSGFVVGRSMGRGVIGGSSGAQTIGGSKTRALSLRGEN